MNKDLECIHFKSGWKNKKISDKLLEIKGKVCILVETNLNGIEKVCL